MTASAEKETHSNAAEAAFGYQIQEEIEANARL